MAFALLNRIFGGPDPKDEWRPLYAAIVARAREPHWYLAGAVPDTLDGRFEMVTLIASLVWIRMGDYGDLAQDAAVHLTELLIDDMEGQIREIGFGDQVVGKRMGEMMSAVGGRLGAYRAGQAYGAIKAALIRNVYRGNDPQDDELAHMLAETESLSARLLGCELADLKSGVLGR
jgi:cytochrome b pre-mRNA-processing protein 3